MKSVYRLASKIIPRGKLRTKLNRKFYSFLSTLSFGIEQFEFDNIKMKLHKTIWTKRQLLARECAF